MLLYFLQKIHIRKGYKWINPVHEILEYDRKSQFDDPLLTVEEQLEKHEKMLDEYIFSNLKFDVGSFYNFGGIGSMMQTLAYEGKTDLVSTFESIKAEAENAIEDTIENYRN